MYLRTSRLDLDDYNNDTEDGLHITSMAGTWLAIVKGIGGMRIKNDHLQFNPFLPKKWKSIAFKVLFRGATIQVKIGNEGTSIQNLSNKDVKVSLFGISYQIPANENISLTSQSMVR